jgi:hypothetical protein
MNLFQFFLCIIITSSVYITNISALMIGAHHEETISVEEGKVFTVKIPTDSDSSYYKESKFDKAFLAFAGLRKNAALFNGLEINYRALEIGTPHLQFRLYCKHSPNDDVEQPQHKFLNYKITIIKQRDKSPEKKTEPSPRYNLRKKKDN